MNDMDVIFDIDGTLMNIEHRRHLVGGPNPMWDKFRALTCADTPYKDICAIFTALEDAAHTIFITTGREESERDITEMQLHAAGLHGYVRMYMRPAGDNTRDPELKQGFLSLMRKQGYDPKIVFDDRQSVVDMWRENGLTCLQVRPGDF
jgi:phosphoglycolate phosphatase-like HAD superfamily hydrolase